MEVISKIQDLIKNLYAVDKLQGCTEQEIAFMKQMFGELPSILEALYESLTVCKCGR